MLRGGLLISLKMFALISAIIIRSQIKFGFKFP